MHFVHCDIFDEDHLRRRDTNESMCIIDLFFKNIKNKNGCVQFM